MHPGRPGKHPYFSQLLLQKAKGMARGPSTAARTIRARDEEMGNFSMPARRNKRCNRRSSTRQDCIFFHATHARSLHTPRTRRLLSYCYLWVVCLSIMDATENLRAEIGVLVSISILPDMRSVLACLPYPLNWKRREDAYRLFARSLAKSR